MTPCCTYKSLATHLKSRIQVKVIYHNNHELIYYKKKSLKYENLRYISAKYCHDNSERRSYPCNKQLLTQFLEYNDILAHYHSLHGITVISSRRSRTLPLHLALPPLPPLASRLSLALKLTLSHPSVAARHSAPGLPTRSRRTLPVNRTSRITPVVIDHKCQTYNGLSYFMVITE